MNHVFNMNGYISTVRELTSGKYYKIVMKKSHKIVNHHNEKEERDTDLMLIPEMCQMHEEVKPVKETIEEKANIPCDDFSSYCDSYFACIWH